MSLLCRNWPTPTLIILTLVYCVWPFFLLLSAKSVASQPLDKTTSPSQVTKPINPIGSIQASDSVLGACFSFDNRQIVTKVRDAVIVWNWSTGEKVRTIDAEGDGIVLSPDGSIIAVLNGGELGAGGRLVFTSLRTGAPLRTIKGSTNIRRCAFASNGKLAAGVEEHGRIHLVDLATGTFYRELSGCGGEAGGANPVAFSPDGKRIASGGTDGTIRVWECSSGKQVLEIVRPKDTPKEAWRAFFLTFSQDGKTLICGYGLGGTRVWDIASGRQLRAIPVPIGSRSALSPDGEFVATVVGRVGNNWNFRLWEMATGQPVRDFSGHKEPIASFHFSSNHLWLASASMDKSVLVWELHSLDAKEKAGIPKPLSEEAIARLWTDLDGKDAVRAFGALCVLLNVPDQATRLAREQLKPIPPKDPENIKKLIGDLNHDQFETRDAASAVLGRLGSIVDAELRERLTQAIPPEARRRIEELLSALDANPYGPDELRQNRAIHLLESIQSSEAAAILKELGKGEPSARQTQRALASFQRLQMNLKRKP